MPIPVKVVQTGLEQSIDAAARKAGKNLRINMGPGAKSIESLSKPLGRLTGKADEFTKSMEAANARVLAFGASVGVISAVTKGFKDLVTTTIQVEKSLANINSILQQNDAQLSKFKDNIFNVAKNTEQTFENVAEAALELSRQGLKAEEITKRLNDALILSRLSGLSAADAVAGLTAAINSFSSAGLTSAQVLNKISAAAASAAVSDRDLIEGLKRSGSVAITTGVSFDNLVGIIGALQEKTARGGAVIGNSLKTIFTRIQDIDKLKAIQNLGVEVTDLAGNVLASDKIIQNLAPTFAKLEQASKVSLADNLVGKFQIAPFLALLEQYNEEVARSGEIANKSLNASDEAYKRNEALNLTLSAAINKAVVSLKELGNTLGEIGVTDNLKNVLSFFNTVVTSIEGVLDGDGLGAKFAKGLVKGIGNILSGPGLALALVAIGKLLFDFAKFGSGALKTFFGLNKAAEAQATLQGQIAASLLNDKGIRQAILDIEKRNISEGEKKKLQTAFFTKALNEQLAVMQKMQSIARTITPGVMAGTASARGGKRAAGGFLPVGAERSDIARGVGGAPSSAKPVIIPNFAFGGGQRGTMVANDSEYIVPNYANGGDAIFNQNMASSMGLPANARKVRAASGFIPNFASTTIQDIIAKPSNFIKADGTFKSKTASNLYESGSASQKATIDAYRKGRGTAGSSSVIIPASRYGVAAVFPEKKTKDSSTNPATLTSSLAKAAAQQGISNIKFEGIQIGTIHNAKENLKKKKNQFKNKIAKLFVNPVAQLGADIIQVPFQGNDAADLNKAVSEVAKSGGGVDLFSSSVEGGIFESAIRLITKKAGGIKAFNQEKDDQRPFDFEEGANTPNQQFKKTFGFSPSLLKADGKRTASTDAVRSVIAKAFNDNSQRQFLIQQIKKANPNFDPNLKVKGLKAKNSAGGYIPNFAEGALEEAIGREKAAGLPISQIRVNQSGKLRNSQNPMGLAVTNTRDEPTGAIPNYAKEGNAPVTDMLSKLFAVQMGFSALSGVLGEVTEKNKLVSGSLTALNTVISAMMVAQSFGGKAGGVAAMASGMSQARGGAFLARAGTSAVGMRGVGSGIFKVLMGGATAAGGALLSFAAPITAIALSVWALKKGFDWLSGTSEALEKNQGRLSEASSNAARELSEIQFSPQRQESFKKTNEAMAISYAQKLDDRGFQGFSDSDNKEALQKLINAALDAGASGKQIDRAIEISTGKDGKILAPQIDRLGKYLEDLAKTDFSGRKDAFLESITKEQRAILADKSSPEAIKKGSELKSKLRAGAKGQFGEMGIELVDQALEQAAQKGETLLGDIGRVSTDIAKATLTAELNILKIKSQALTEDEKKLSLAKITKSLTESQVLGLQKNIDLNKQDVETGLKIANIIKERINGIDKINLSEKQTKDLQDKLAGVSAERLTQEGEFENILRSVLTVEQQIPGAVEKIVELNKKNLEGIKKEGEEKKKNIVSTERQRQKELEVNQTIKTRLADLQRAAAASKIKSDFQFSSRASSISLARSLFNTNPNLTQREKAQAEVGFVQAEGQLSVDQAEADAVEKSREELNKLSKDLNENLKPVVEEFLKLLDTEGFAALSQIQARINDGVQGNSAFGEVDPDAASALKDYSEVTAETGKKAVEGAKNQATANNILAESALKATGAVKTFSTLLKEFVESLRTQAEQLRFDSLGTQDSSSMISNLDQRILNARILKKPTDVGISQANRIAGIEQMDRQILMAGSRGERNQLGREREVLVRQLALKEQIIAIDAQAPDAEQELLEIRSKLLALEKERSQLQKTRTLKQRLEDRKLDPIDIQDQFLTKLEDASVTFKDNFVSAFAEGIQSVDSLKDSLLNAANQFLQTMTKAFVQKWMDGASSSDGGLLGALFGSKKKASGGYISGGSGNKDDVPAMLMGGEFVMNKKAVQKYGMGFMSALNSGSIQGFARGGQVRDREGMFSTPGMNGAGPIVGGRNLMAFATQSPFALTRDTFTGNGAFLDAESGRMTMFGRRNNPQFQRVQDAKRSAFDLAIREEEAKAQAREQRVSLGSMLASAAISTIVSYGASKAIGGDAGRLFGSGIGNLAGTAITGAPSSGGALGAAATDPEAMQSVSDLFSKIPGVGRYFKTSATGGLIPSAGGTDTVPTMLSGGEFVMNAAATRNIGAGNLQALNSGAGTGDNSDLVAKLDELIRTTESSKSTGEINITINGSNGTETQTAGQETTEDQRALSERIKVAVKQVIADEKRLGGQLRR